MKKYSGNQTVDAGFYFDRKSKDLITIEKDAEKLPGTDENTYVRVPVGFVMIFGPFLGLIYVMFLPFISFVMIIHAIGSKAWKKVQQAKAAARALRITYSAPKKVSQKPASEVNEERKVS